MENTKIIITSVNEYSNLLKDRLKLYKLSNPENLEVFVGKRDHNNDTEQIVLICSNLDKGGSKKIIDYITSNYMPQKIVYIGNACIVNDIDLKIGDVIIPNTFIETNNDTPLFIDYAIGDSFDLNKFGLVLSGFCLTSEKKEKCFDENNDYITDVFDGEVYPFLSLINENKLLDKTVVVKEIIDENSGNNSEKEITGNGVNILELIL